MTDPVTLPRSVVVAAIASLETMAADNAGSDTVAQVILQLRAREVARDLAQALKGE